LSYAGRVATAVEQLTALCDADVATVAANRTAGDVLATQIGGELALRWGIAVVRAVIAAPPDADAVREAYGELVDRFRDDPAAMVRVRALGDDIRQLEAEGKLPSTLVARSDRRKK
jgi:hypothetical protein